MSLPWVLASGSRYRKSLLERLGIPFSVVVPDTDEAPQPEETAGETALRLAERKAVDGAARFGADCLAIGSDQVAALGALRLGKPGNFERAREQLREVQGRTVAFHTGLCLYNTRSGIRRSRLVTYEVTFRSLNDAQITRYLEKEQPYDCAGSARAEALGISLIERMSGDDPNALVGLPLIALIDLLHAEGVEIP